MFVTQCSCPGFGGQAQAIVYIKNYLQREIPLAAVKFAVSSSGFLAHIRNYFPDFIARLTDGSHWVIETKGREDIEVAMKDGAAQNWCETATELTGVQWNYIKVLQKDFEGLRPGSFEELHIGIKTLFSN